jgi:hypothetical protein
MVVKSFLLYPLSGLLLLTAFLSFGEEKVTKPAIPAPEPRVNIEPRVKPSKEADDAEAKREPSIRVETQLVLINVTVTDPMNRFVTGLEKEHFKLTEDKTEQTITQFSSEDAPLSVGLVFDASGSMVSCPSRARRPPNSSKRRIRKTSFSWSNLTTGPNWWSVLPRTRKKSKTALPLRKRRVGLRCSTESIWP